MLLKQANNVLEQTRYAARGTLRRLAIALLAAACGTGVAMLAFRLSWLVLGRSSPVSVGVLVYVGVVFAVPMLAAAFGWGLFSAGPRRFGWPFGISTTLCIGCVTLVTLYFRSPGEPWVWWDGELIPWLVAIGFGSSALALIFALGPRKSSLVTMAQRRRDA